MADNENGYEFFYVGDRDISEYHEEVKEREKKWKATKEYQAKLKQRKAELEKNRRIRDSFLTECGLSVSKKQTFVYVFPDKPRAMIVRAHINGNAVLIGPVRYLRDFDDIKPESRHFYKAEMINGRPFGPVYRSQRIVVIQGEKVFVWDVDHWAEEKLDWCRESVHAHVIAYKQLPEFRYAGEIPEINLSTFQGQTQKDINPDEPLDTEWYDEP